MRTERKKAGQMTEFDEDKRGTSAGNMDEAGSGTSAGNMDEAGPGTSAGNMDEAGPGTAAGDVDAADKPVVLEVSHLTKIFDDSQIPGADGMGNRVIVDLSLQVRKNDFLCILGPSGCGKTTLLRCIGGFENFEGKIRINGIERRTPGTDRIMVFQDYNQLFPWKTVEKNIQYGLKLKGIRDKEELRRLSDHALETVGLSGYQKYYPHQLSGGMKQRVAIAKALALKPEIILMDEPFAALDAITRNTLQQELLRISADQDWDCTIIFITHNIQEAIVLGTRIMVMEKGGTIAVNEKNPIRRPVTPASEGYGAYWNKLHAALYRA